MRLRRFTAAAALAIAGLAATLSAAAAYPAVATSALNVRSGPGTQYTVLGTLQQNQVVEVFECTAAGWCQVQDRTLNGWASARYLSRVTSAPTPQPQPQPQQPGANITIETPNFSFSVGNGSRPGYRPPSVGQVCFFDEYNFRGRQVCAGSGDEDRYLVRAWDDVIRSIRIEGSVEVTVCSGVNLSGDCATITQSASSLGQLNDRISSYRVNRF